MFELMIITCLRKGEEKQKIIAKGEKWKDGSDGQLQIPKFERIN